MLYDDRDGDGTVAYRVKPSKVEITESKYWHVKVQSSSNSWSRGGLVDPNLSFWIDGAILRYLNWGEASPGREWALENVETDGEIDWRVEVVDADDDGISDYQLQRLQAQFPEDMPVFRSSLYVNENNETPIPYSNYVFWPLLLTSHNYEGYNYFDHPPAIAMAWEQGKIDRVGIMGYPAERGYHINSRSAAWQNNRLNYADFENPMAYYDLAGDADGQAELFVRLEVYPPHDRFFMNGNFPDAMTSVEYAWDQDNDGGWDYQVSLGGRQAIRSEVPWPNFSLVTVPYEDVPDWVLGQEWDAALLVAAESGGHWNSEGMSIWNVNRGFRDGRMVEPSGLRNGYLTGFRDDPPIEDYSEIPEGFRGEWAFEYRRRPWLYLSPVDDKLHLAHAAGGVWALDQARQVRFKNLDGDAYLDRWEYWRQGELRESLTQVEDHLIYIAADQVVLKKVDSAASLFERRPPDNKDTWLSLGSALDQYDLDFAATDLRKMLARFPGTESRIIGAGARGVRITDSGFGFVLTLTPGFQVEGANLLGLAGLAAGDYWVAYAGDFEVSAVIPARLEIAPLYEAAWADALRPGEQVALAFEIKNTGQEDAWGVRLAVQFNKVDGDPASSWEWDAAIDVPAGGSAEVAVPWMPTESGEWRVRSEVMAPANEEGECVDVLFEGRVWVGEAEAPRVRDTLRAFGLVTPGTVLILMVAVMAVGAVAGRACCLICRSDQQKPQGHGAGK